MNPQARRLVLVAAAVVVTGLAGGAGPIAAHPAGFSIDQVMQAPFPSSLIAAPDAKAVAWVFDARGSRNVWVADTAHGMTGRAVTTFTGDDGLNIGELAWSPDARLLAFTRGGSLEDERPANTDSTADGPVPREVWLAASEGGSARQVRAGHSPAFSPDGHRLVFLDGTRIWTYATDGSTPPQTLLIDEGRVASATFSPDGERLAFVSSRVGHAFIGVYDFATRHIRWMSPSLDADSAPTFSADGSRVAFIRVPTETVPAFVTRRAGEPWSIWVADVATGAARRVWLADAGAGSIFQPTQSEQNLLWTQGDRLVFPWEKTGWLQLYAVAARGGAAQPLTSGAFEIAHLTLSADRSRLVYSSNQDDRDRLHIWSLDLDHGHPVRLARDFAIEDSPQASPDGTLYALRSDAAQPLAPVMLVSGRWQPLAPGSVPRSFPEAQLVKPQSVSFPATDGQRTYGQIFLPQDDDRAPRHAALLFFHGGPERQMLLGFHPMDAYTFMYALDEYFVSEGYVVLSVNYRGGSGYGLDFREAKGAGAGGASELNDLTGAIAYLKARPDIDARRIGIWGGSYGGLMTALGLARASSDLAAGVDYAGLYDWVSFLQAIGLPASPAAAPLALASSPSATIDAWKSPVLVVQADDDRDVPFSQSAELIEALRTHHIEHDEMILPNEIHDLSRYASWMSFFEATDRYFERHLQGPDAGARRP